MAKIFGELHMVQEEIGYAGSKIAVKRWFQFNWLHDPILFFKQIVF